MSSVFEQAATVDDLLGRAASAVTPAERAACAEEIDRALTGTWGPSLKGRLHMARARARADDWDTAGVLDDAMAAMELFEQAAEGDSALDAASLATSRAARMGNLSLAVELATRCICSLNEVGDDNLVSDVTNRLGMFCYSFLDYDRAVEQFRRSLEAAERSGDQVRLLRGLHNIADALLLAVRQDRAAGEGDGRFDRCGGDRLARADEAVERLRAEGTEEDHRRIGTQRLEAEMLLEKGLAEQALGLLRSKAAFAGAVKWAAGQSALALVEARCLRALGRPAEAIAVAERARALASTSRDAHEIVLVLDEVVAAEREAGHLAEAVADALELKRLMWVIHQGQTAQMVDQVWARAALELEHKALEAQTAAAMRSAEQDALTRIGNRRLLERVLADEAATGGLIAVLMADIDHFKRINDTFGHDVGDHVLRALGMVLASDARPGQTVVRYGGEEFVFVLPGVELRSAAHFAERVRARVSNHEWADLEARLHVTVSIGVAAGGSADWHGVLAAADRALYLAKQRGRNRVEVAPEAMRASA